MTLELACSISPIAIGVMLAQLNRRCTYLMKEAPDLYIVDLITFS